MSDEWQEVACTCVYLLNPDPDQLDEVRGSLDCPVHGLRDA